MKKTISSFRKTFLAAAVLNIVLFLPILQPAPQPLGQTPIATTTPTTISTATPVPTAVPQPTSQPTPTAPPQNGLPQAALPLVTEQSAHFGRWRAKAPSDLSASCQTLHDRFWTRGDDGKAYHTWHPAVYGECQFGHEHGLDPATSHIFDYGGGYPPFGYVMAQQQHASPNQPRDEDHFGHKVVVANDIRLAIGNSADGLNPVVYDAAITCDWYSKIHQGAYTADALTNHLHEYFLTVQCDDTHQSEPTAFSVKILAPWGYPNRIVSTYNGHHIIDPVTSHLTSQLINPWDNAIDPIRPPHVAEPVGAGGEREFESFQGLQYKSWDPTAQEDQIRQPELWGMNRRTGSHSVDTPGGSISFAPYYIVKNPARLLGLPDNLLVRTVDLCYDQANQRKLGGFCAILPATHPGPEWWYTTDSPFNGTVRAVNFKGIGLNNATGPSEFCTDPFGANAYAMPCNLHDIHQKAAPIRNYWLEQTYAESQHCIVDRSGVCHQQNLEGTLERWTLHYQNNQWVAVNVGAQQAANGSYIGAGIGFEWIINQGNEPGVQPPN